MKCPDCLGTTAPNGCAAPPGTTPTASANLWPRWSITPETCPDGERSRARPRRADSPRPSLPESARSVPLLFAVANEVHATTTPSSRKSLRCLSGWHFMTVTGAVAGKVHGMKTMFGIDEDVARRLRLDIAWRDTTRSAFVETRPRRRLAEPESFDDRPADATVFPKWKTVGRRRRLRRALPSDGARSSRVRRHHLTG